MGSLSEEGGVGCAGGLDLDLLMWVLTPGRDLRLFLCIDLRIGQADNGLKFAACLSLHDAAWLHIVRKDFSSMA